MKLNQLLRLIWITPLLIFFNSESPVLNSKTHLQVVPSIHSFPITLKSNHLRPLSSYPRWCGNNGFLPVPNSKDFDANVTLDSDLCLSRASVPQCSIYAERAGPNFTTASVMRALRISKCGAIPPELLSNLNMKPTEELNSSLFESIHVQRNPDVSDTKSTFLTDLWWKAKHFSHRHDLRTSDLEQVTRTSRRDALAVQSHFLVPLQWHHRQVSTLRVACLTQ